MDGREFIKYAPLSVWQKPFPPVVLPISRKQRDKAARAARSLSRPIDPTPVDAPGEPSTDISEPEEKQQVDHFVMNLPDSALTFLDAYRGSYLALEEQGASEGYTKETAKMPVVHVYCFTREMDIEGAGRDICQVSCVPVRLEKMKKETADLLPESIRHHWLSYQTRYD